MEIDIPQASRKMEYIDILYIRIDLKPKSEAKFNRYTGFSIRSICYNIFRQTKPYDPKIHDENTPKPFSVSPLLSISNGDIHPCYYTSDREVFFEVILNTGRIPISLFKNYFYVGREIRLDENVFQITNVDIKNFLLGKYFQDIGNPVRFTLNFYTPTLFRYEVFHPYYSIEEMEISLLKKRSKNTIYHFYPEPKYLIRSIFRTLRDIYNISFPDILIKDSIQYLIDGYLVISRIEGMETRPLGDPPYKGFIGRVEYLFRDDTEDNKDMREFIIRLLKFGELFGVGVGRTNGMGRYKILI